MYDVKAKADLYLEIVPPSFGGLIQLLSNRSIINKFIIDTKQ